MKEGNTWELLIVYYCPPDSLCISKHNKNPYFPGVYILFEKRAKMWTNSYVSDSYVADKKNELKRAVGMVEMYWGEGTPDSPRKWSRSVVSDSLWPHGL